MSKRRCFVDGTEFAMPVDNEADPVLPGGGIIFMPSGTTYPICIHCMDFVYAKRNPMYQQRDEDGTVEVKEREIVSPSNV